jgi:hypothetical protein
LNDLDKSKRIPAMEKGDNKDSNNDGVPYETIWSAATTSCRPVRRTLDPSASPLKRTHLM